MEQESRNSKRHDPEEWTRVFNLQIITPWEYFTGLIACGRTASASAIVKAVPDSVIPEFKKYVMEMKDVKEDSEFTCVGGDELVFGVNEVQKLVKWFESAQFHR